MNNKEYWLKRRKKEIDKQIKDCAKIEKLLKKYYRNALDGISKEVAFLFSKYAKDNNLNYHEAQKYLSKDEFREWRMDLMDYMKLIQETGDERILLELNSLSMRSRISRLEHLYYEVDKHINELYKSTENSLQALFTDTISTTYYENIYGIHKEIGVGASFAHVDDKMIRQLLSTPFYGTNYSERIWRKRAALRYAVRDSMVDMMVRGKGSREVAKVLAVKMDSSYKDAIRLVNTEHAHFASEASFAAYEEMDVDRYQYIATFDNRTCSTCAGLDGLIKPISEREAGVNAPVMHPRDRCTTIPYYDSLKIRNRAARDSKGKTIEVPGDMTYDEWFDIFGEK